MLRFNGNPLPPKPSIAVVANDALGNFVVATPLLQMLRSKHPDARIAYFGGKRTRELQEASDLFHEQASLHGGSPDEFSGLIAANVERFDLVVNLESTATSKTFAALIAKPEGFVAGPSAGVGFRGDLPFPDDPVGRLWQDREWIAADLTARYPFLESGFIGEIFCRGSYLDGPIPHYKLPRAEPEAGIPDVLIGASASLPEKLWPVDAWTEVLRELAVRGYSVGLLGAKPSDQRSLWLGSSAEEVLVRNGLVLDLRGRFSLPEVVGALGRARAALTLDNGILHFAVAAGSPTVGLYRHGIHRLWAPPFSGLRVLTPGEGRSVAEIEPAAVIEAVLDGLESADPSAM